MEEYKQGETYQEDSINTEEQITPSALNTNKIKLLIGLGAVVLVAVVFLFTAANKKKEKSDMVADDMSEEIAWEQFVAAQEGSGVSIEDDTVKSNEPISFSNETVLSLRKYGYTGDEIEYAMANGINYEYMIEEAKALIESTNEEVIRELNDSSSEAYKKLLKMTWLGGKKIKIKDLSSDPDARYSLDTYVVNGDYVKCEPRGNQLFIRITLDDNSYAFMTVEPTRWVSMKDEGNIVVQYDLYTYGKVKVITNITEVVQGDTNATN